MGSAQALQLSRGCDGSGRLKPFKLRTFHNKFISLHADGTVKQANSPGALELLEAVFMQELRAFRTVHDTFLTAMNAEHNWERRQHSKLDEILEWENFEVIALNDNQLALNSHHGTLPSTITSWRSTHTTALSSERRTSRARRSSRS